MAETYQFRFKLDNLYEQGSDLADAIAEMIEAESDLRSTWLGGDELGMSSFYNKTPAVYQADYSRSSFNTGKIVLADRSDAITQPVLEELIAAGLLNPKEDILKAAGVSAFDSRDRAGEVAATYFEKTGLGPSTSLVKLKEDFDPDFTD